MKVAFTERFVEKPTPTQLATLRDHLQQRANELCQIFFDRVNTAHYTEGAQIPERLRKTSADGKECFDLCMEAAVRTSFLSGLKDPYKRQVNGLKDCRTAVEYLEAAKQLERANTSKQMGPQVNALDNNARQIEKHIHAIAAQQVAAQLAQTNLQVAAMGRGRGSGRGANPSFRGGGGAGRGGVRMCYNCDSTEHIIKYCPLPRRVRQPGYGPGTRKKTFNEYHPGVPAGNIGHPSGYSKSAAGPMTAGGGPSLRPAGPARGRGRGGYGAGQGGQGNRQVHELQTSQDAFAAFADVGQFPGQADEAEDTHTNSFFEAGYAAATAERDNYARQDFQ